MNQQRTRTSKGGRQSIKFANSTGKPRTWTEKQLEEQQNRCAKCHVALNTTPGRHGFERDHQVPLSETPYNRHRAPNWILCKACHARKTAEDQAKRKNHTFPLVPTGWQSTVKKRKAVAAQARDRNLLAVQANKRATAQAKKEWTARYGKAGSETKHKEKVRRFYASKADQRRANERKLQAMIRNIHGH